MLPPNNSPFWPLARLVLLVTALAIFAEHFDATEVKVILGASFAEFLTRTRKR